MLEQLLAIRAQLKALQNQVSDLIDREMEKATKPAEEPPPAYMGS